MKIPSAIIDLRRVVDRNSPVILTGLSLVGLGASVYFTFRGTQKATHTISAEEIKRDVVVNNPDNGQPDFAALTNREKFLLTYKFYAPAALATVGTGTCMILATKIGLNRTAAIGAALVVAERNNEQYRDKAKELFGDAKETKVTDAVAKDEIDKISIAHLGAARDGEQIFFDLWSGRPFYSTREAVGRVVNEFNHEMLYGSYASLNELYAKFGLEDIEAGDEIGWNKERLLEVIYTGHIKEVHNEPKAVMGITFDRKPFATFRDNDV